MHFKRWNIMGSMRYVGVTTLIMLMNSVAAQGQIIDENDKHFPVFGARGAAMGEAYTADISDVAAMYWNSATLPFLERSSIVIDHYNEWNSGIMNDAVAAPFILSPGKVLALSGMVSYFGYFGSGYLSHERAMEYGIDVAYSQIISPGLSAGIRVAGRTMKITNTAWWIATWSGGVLYNPSPDISYGLSYGEIGEAVVVDNTSTLTKERLPRRLQMGITMRYPSVKSRRIISIAVANEKIFDRSGLYYKVGLELFPVTFIALRTGYISGPDVSAPRFGVGVQTDILQIDYAVSPAADDVQFQQFMMSVMIR